MSENNKIEANIFTVAFDKRRSQLIQLILNAAYNHQGDIRQFMQENNIPEQEIQDLYDEFGQKIHDRDDWCIDPDCEW